MSTTLDQIVSYTRSRIAERERAFPAAQLERQAVEHQPRGFRRALLAASESGAAVIAELKKASPSKGVIRESFDAAALASELEACGASALSVLTEEKWFQGSLQNLRAASAATALPCLRKDFIVHEYQILEARANAADAVLLIAAALPGKELEKLLRSARARGLDALVEAHDAEEIERALAGGAEIVGVNSRNLKTLEVDPRNHERLARMLPENILRVAESAIASGKDLRRLKAAGYQAFLIGESLMRHPHPGNALQHILNEAAEAAAQRR